MSDDNYYLPKKAGDIIFADDWNTVQRLVRKDIKDLRDHCDAIDLPLAASFSQLPADGSFQDVTLALTNRLDKPWIAGGDPDSHGLHFGKRVLFKLDFVAALPESAATEGADGILVREGPDEGSLAGGTASVWRLATEQQNNRRCWTLKAEAEDSPITLLGTGKGATLTLRVPGLAARQEGITHAVLTCIDGWDTRWTIGVPLTKVKTWVPAGMIAMWSGRKEDIPAGWALCDGLNNTPDLRDKFILGAGGTAGPRDDGGTRGHSHGNSAESIEMRAAGDHHHRIEATWTHYNTSSGNTNTIRDIHVPQETGWTEGHSHSLYGSVRIDESDHLPPWYALCFIMKTA